MKLSFLFSFSLIMTTPSLVWAAACCGGGFATPSIITGDDKAQLTTAYSATEVLIDNVDSRGIWRRWEDHQRVETLRIDGATLISDRWQLGFTLPVVQRQRTDQRSAGLGDLASTVGYEFLPDWDYHPVRPKGIGFIQLTAPTGLARGESEMGGLDSRGNGFWALGLGSLFTKSMGRFDLLASASVHHSFPKPVDNSQIQGTLEPGFGTNVSLGGGYHFSDFRLGSSVTWTSEDPVDVRGSTFSEGTPERYATALFSISYRASTAWTGTLSYADQTLVGSPLNTSLGKTLGFSLQRRWER